MSERTEREMWLHVRRGLALAASLFEHDKGIPMRCAACRVARGLPGGTPDQCWHDMVMQMIARIEADQGFQPRCPECRQKRHETARMEELRHG